MLQKKIYRISNTLLNADYFNGLKAFWFLSEMSTLRRSIRKRTSTRRRCGSAKDTDNLSKFKKKVVTTTTHSVVSGSMADLFLDMLQEQEDCDVTFVVGPSNEVIRCHKIFLKARSPVFKAMFSRRWDGEESIKIPDIEAQTFRAFLQFLYGDKIENNVEVALELFEVANKYSVEPLTSAVELVCRKAMKLEDCVHVFQVGRKYDSKELMNMAYGIMTMSKSLELLLREDILLEMDKETLTCLLSQDIMTASELDLFRIAVKWGELQVKYRGERNLREALASIIPLIRFPSMTATDFVHAVIPSGVLEQEDHLKLLIYFASDHSARVKASKKLNFNTAPRNPVKAAVIAVSFYDSPIIGEENSALSALNDQIRFKIDALWLWPKRCAIISIVLRCPVKNASRLMPTEIRFNQDDYFKISVLKTRKITDSEREQDRDENIFNDTTRIISPVKLQWGTVMEISVTPWVLLEDAYDYCITLEQIQMARIPHLYTYHPLGDPVSFREISFDDRKLKFIPIRSSRSMVGIVQQIRVGDVEEFERC